MLVLTLYLVCESDGGYIQRVQRCLAMGLPYAADLVVIAENEVNLIKSLTAGRMECRVKV